MIQEVVRLPSLTEVAANQIREAILHGQLASGTPLPEVELSKDLNVSRGTVREALRLLQNEGLVETSPYRGACVTKLSPQKAEEIYTFRALLEPYAVRLALEKKAYKQEDLDHLAGLIQKLGELNRQGDTVNSVWVDMEFHHVLCQPSGHSLLLQVLSNLQSQTLFFILHTKLYRSDLTSDDVSHAVILEAICAGDPANAECILKKHLVEAGQSLLNHMASGISEDSSG